MNRITAIFSIAALLFCAIPAVPASAGDCFVDPVIEYDGSGTIKSGVFMRDHACMEGSTVLTTLSAGASVSVVGYTDGWYRVEYNGGRGWIGQQFLNNAASQTGKEWGWGEYHAYMSAYPSSKPSAAAQTQTQQQSGTQNRYQIMNRTRGYILLQVEEHGEAWYMDPVTDNRYYMKDGPTAYQMMRSFGLGVTDADYNKIAAGDWSLKNRLRGRIILRVQANGEAYYIHPKDLAVHYLQNGDEAYRIMRLYSLGITNTDLSQLTSSEIPVK